MCARDPLSNSLVTLDQSINLKPQDTLIEDTPQQTPVESGGTKFINLEPQDTLIEDTPQQTPVESGGVVWGVALSHHIPPDCRSSGYRLLLQSQ